MIRIEGYDKDEMDRIDNELLEMDGEEFYRFLQTKEEATQTPPLEVESEKEAAKTVHRIGRVTVRQ